jgi:hypothetical protein
MPVSYTIEKGYAYCKAAGNYTFNEAYSNYKSALDDPLFLPGYNLLIDVFDSKETRTSDEMQKIAYMLAMHPKFGKKCAMLVNQAQPVRYGLARLLSSLAEIEKIDISIFSTRADAEKFLKS